MGQEWVTILVALISGSGLGGTVAAVYSARSSAKTGQSGNEVEAAKAASADWASFTERITAQMAQQDEKIGRLETKVRTLEAGRAIDAAWIDLLQEHIWLGKQPPPPSRPTSTEPRG